MTRLRKGETLSNFSFDTPFEKNLDFLKIAAMTKRTALVFLRYYGCTLCQLDIHDFKESYDQIEKVGGQLLVVLQSDPQYLADELKDPNALPFRIVCDPNKQLYQMFDIMPAKNKLGMIGLHTVGKIEKAKKAGFVHGKYEGDELQLPAAFITDESGKLLYVNYAKSVDGVPTAEELIKEF